MPNNAGAHTPTDESSANHQQWLAGHRDEIAFWDEWLATRGGLWPDSFRNRIDPQRPLQPFFEALLPPDCMQARILDVGAGPLTFVGFQSPKRSLEVVAVDPLAPAYDDLLARHGIQPVSTHAVGRCRAAHGLLCAQ